MLGSSHQKGARTLKTMNIDVNTKIQCQWSIQPTDHGHRCLTCSRHQMTPICSCCTFSRTLPKVQYHVPTLLLIITYKYALHACKIIVRNHYQTPHASVSLPLSPHWVACGYSRWKKKPKAFFFHLE